MRVIESDLSKARRARTFANLLFALSLGACALWPRSVAWAFLPLPLSTFVISQLAKRRGAPRLEIFPDRLIIKQRGVDDVVLMRKDVSVFAIVELKHGEAVVAFSDPPPLKYSLRRASDIALPNQLAISTTELQAILSNWLINAS